MKVVCAWCKTLIMDGPEEKVSHGICQPCWLIAKANLAKLKEIRRKKNEIPADYSGTCYV